MSDPEENKLPWPYVEGPIASGGALGYDEDDEEWEEEE